jgi:hypothetical protein
MKARDRVEEAARWRLDIGEPLLAGGFAWIAFPRPQVSTAFLARKAHLVGITDRRFLIWSRPHEVRPAEDKDLLLDSPLADVTVDGVRAFSPMLQVRLTTEAGRKLVLEFRPRDRRLGHRIAESLGSNGDGGANPTPPATEVSTTPS